MPTSKIKQFLLKPRALAALLALPLILALAFAVSAQGGLDPNNQPAEVLDVPAAQVEPTIPPPPPGMEGQVTYTPNGEWILNTEIGVTPAQDAAAVELLNATSADGGLRHVYISSANFTGQNADTGCVAGYHLASLWEILDATHIIYDPIPEAKIQADMGKGPAANWWGWVRTGGAASVANTAGTANCNLWASTTSTDYGSLVRLTSTWAPGGPDIMSWEAQTWSCAGIAPVWCVKD